ncbi:PQQ-binding-like beta-propeller repeat protein [Cellulomonas endophytica]|uniref:PQQ-binding-like beta-propeller repeat protein n=1 Tax=Cellulomonas endophytica TaxID=2494735 RepID=UPI0010128C1E
MWTVGDIDGGHATDGRQVVVSTAEGRLEARNLRTGRLLWQVPVPDGVRAAVSSGRHGLLLVGGGLVSHWRPPEEPR